MSTKYLCFGIYSLHLTLCSVLGTVKLNNWKIKTSNKDKQFDTSILYITHTTLLLCATECARLQNSLSLTYSDDKCTCYGQTFSTCSTNPQYDPGSNYYEKDGTVVDCYDLKACGLPSGVYTINSENPISEIQVYCDMSTTNPGIVIQKRHNGSINFYRNWNDYKNGFGTLNGEFWIGNDNLHKLTKQNKYKVRVDLEDNYGNIRYAEFGTFIIGDEEDKYRITIGQYSGNAGDDTGFSYNNGWQFSTYDKDIRGFGCPQERQSGWWFDYCTWVNMNGLWTPGTNAWSSMMWYNWRGTEGMKKTSMKLKRK